jgi:D-glycerate 3-kinase
MSAQFVDDKTPNCVPFILEHLAKRDASSGRPFVIGLNGVQGAGKTTLVSALASTLEGQGVHTLVCSIDDFYLNHEDLVALGKANPDNALVQHRGEPGTHDLALAREVFSALVDGRPTTIPTYDKSAYNGHGDRAPASAWRAVNQPGQPRTKAVILEGWSVGFRALSDADVEAKWNGPSRTLQKHKLEHLLFVNERLKGYDALTDLFDAFIHIDAEDLEFVYNWRSQQEEHLRRDKGDPNAGMSPEQVIKFVDCYFPAYELYTDKVRQGILPGRPGHQLRMIVGPDRKVKEVFRI